MIASASAYLALEKTMKEPPTDDAGRGIDRPDPRHFTDGSDPPMTSSQYTNGEDHNFISALRSLIDRVRIGWVVSMVIISFVGHLLMSLIANGWILSVAKSSDIVDLRKDIEVSTAAFRADLAKHSSEITTIQSQNLALGNLIASQAAALARLEEGQRGISARLDVWRKPPCVIQAGSPGGPAPQPHYHQKAKKKSEGGFLSFATH